MLDAVGLSAEQQAVYGAAARPAADDRARCPDPVPGRAASRQAWLAVKARLPDGYLSSRQARLAAQRFAVLDEVLLRASQNWPRSPPRAGTTTRHISPAPAGCPPSPWLAEEFRNVQAAPTRGRP